MKTKSTKMRAALGIRNDRTAEVQARAKAIYDAMSADPVTYAAPDPPLSELRALMNGLAAMQMRMPERTLGLAAARDRWRDRVVRAWSGTARTCRGSPTANRRTRARSS